MYLIPQVDMRVINMVLVSTSPILRTAPKDWHLPHIKLRSMRFICIYTEKEFQNSMDMNKGPSKGQNPGHRMSFCTIRSLLVSLRTK